MQSYVITIPWVLVILGIILFVALAAGLIVFIVLLASRKRSEKEPAPRARTVRCLRCSMEASDQFQFCPGCGYVLRQ